jgi:predicted metalloprotease with PDZ domain
VWFKAESLVSSRCFDYTQVNNRGKLFERNLNNSLIIGSAGAGIPARQHDFIDLHKNYPNLMKHFLVSVFFAAFVAVNPFGLFAQSKYQYKIDLTKATNHMVQVELLTPRINQSSIEYFFPTIVPGTYAISDYGRFVHELKAFDKTGKELIVEHKNANSWKISNAQQLHKITYLVEDTWHTKIAENPIYPMGGTNIELNKQYVINTPGFFGYFDQLEKIPFEIEFQKPIGFYGSTALTASNSTQTTDLFQLKNVHELYDSPIMYCKPDTVSVSLGNTQVLVSVYAADEKVRAATLAKAMRDLLTATQRYLGGKLPVKKYAFLYSFNNEVNPKDKSGALEHSYSSFYALPQVNEVFAKTEVVDISAHEFFHIITPLSISSKEVKEFNYQQPVLSKHLWLYEGSTEYDAHHVQVKSGLITVPKFFTELAKKRIISKQFNDSLPFTVMSKEVATTYASQYQNVYMKGALINACLDIYLLHLSKGRYGLADLKHDLGIKFGADKFFEDDKLFDEIADLSFPEVKDFLNKYVAGSSPIPYTDFFGLAGVSYHDYVKREVASIGNISVASMGEGKVTIVNASNMDAFGKAMKYKLMDELVEMNDETVTAENYLEVIARLKQKIKQGDTLTVVVRRKNDAGEIKQVKLSAPVSSLKETIEERYKMQLMDETELTPLQRLVQNAWLKNNCN